LLVLRNAVASIGVKVDATSLDRAAGCIAPDGQNPSPPSGDMGAGISSIHIGPGAMQITLMPFSAKGCASPAMKF
jgi:hypothetical protein